MEDFFLAETYADRIAEAFSWPDKATPGTKWVYHTSDHFIAARAMHNYLHAQQDSGVDVFDDLVTNVFEPIKVGPGAHTSLRTSDGGWTGQAFDGYGLWWIHDDIAKLAKLLNNDGGVCRLGLEWAGFRQGYCLFFRQDRSFLLFCPA